MGSRVFKLKPDKTEAFKLESNADDLRECAKWCDGTLTLKFHNGQPVEYGTFITFLEGDTENLDDGVAAIEGRAEIGDYIVKYWDTAKHGKGFFVVKGDRFEEIYEAD